MPMRRVERIAQRPLPPCGCGECPRPPFARSAGRVSRPKAVAWGGGRGPGGLPGRRWPHLLPARYGERVRTLPARFYYGLLWPCIGPALPGPQGPLVLAYVLSFRGLVGLRPQRSRSRVAASSASGHGPAFMSGSIAWLWSSSCRRTRAKSCTKGGLGSGLELELG